MSGLKTGSLIIAAMLLTLTLGLQKSNATTLLEEHFSNDVISSGDWIANDGSVSVDTEHGWLHIAADGNGADDDCADKYINLTLPLVVETRMRLVSGGQHYTLPAIGFYYGPTNNEADFITYLPNDQPWETFGWKFMDAWTNVHTKGPTTENVWVTIKAVLRVDGGELYAKTDGDADFTFVTSGQWSIPTQLIRLRLVQDWDAECDFDYVKVNSFEAPSWCDSREHYAFGCPVSVAHADLNQDSFEDLYSISYCSSEYSLNCLFNDGTGHFDQRSTTSFGSGGLGGPQACTLDIDRDGDLDITFADPANHCLKLMLNDGNGQITQASCVAVPFSAGYDDPFFPTSGDFNEDGYADIAVTCRNSNRLCILLNDHAGGLALSTSYEAGPEPFAVKVARLDGDSHLDLAVSYASSNSVAIWMGSGNGQFTSIGEFAAGDRPYWVAVGNVDSDGDLDLVVGHNLVSYISVMLNDGSGHMSLRQDYNIAAAGGNWSVDLADFNGDGRNDIAAVSVRADNVYVLMNKGLGTFELPVGCWAGDQPWDVAAADFDRNGFSDIAVANYGNSDPAGVSVFLNVGCGDIGSIEGIVSAGSNKLLGVPVDLYDTEGNVIASTSTSANGFYQFAELGRGYYYVAISTPLGYSATEETKGIDLAGCSQTVNFTLSKLNIVPRPRPRTYWACQIQKALAGRPQDITAGNFARYCGLICEHFNSNPERPINEYAVPQPASRLDSLNALRGVLYMSGDDSDDPPLKLIARAQLVTLMLNVVSGKISQVQKISADGRSVSQLLTYCTALINDETDPPVGGNWIGYGSPWFRYIYTSLLLTDVNFGLTLPRGLVPEDVVEVAYKPEVEAILPSAFALEQNHPNPFNPSTEISFSLPSAGSVKLSILNILGEEVATLMNEVRPAGTHTVTWKGTDNSGRPVASGVYLYRMTTTGFTDTKKMLLLK